MKIEISCVQCGANRFNFPEHLTDDDTVRCATCDHEIGTLGQLKDRVEAAVLANRREERRSKPASLRSTRGSYSRLAE